MRTSRITGTTAAAAALALVLTACGGSDDNNDTDAGGGSNTTAEEPGGSDGMDDMDDMETETGGSDDMDDMDSETGDHGDMDMETGGAEGDLSAVMPESTGNPFADARTAAQHMPETGAVFATGFTNALELEGDPMTEAADLRATLTYLLQEHVYLAGMAVATAYVAGPDSAEFELAAEALDGNSVDMSTLVGSLAGEEKAEEFLESWRGHIGYFVDYALAAAEDDDEGRNAAVEDLREYTTEAGMFFEEVSGGELPADAVTESLNGHVDSLAAAVDGLAAGDADTFELLKAASDHVVMGAAVLSEGLATAGGLEGDTADPATELRTALTANLNEHVYLAGIAVFVAYTDEGGTESDAFAAAAAVVDANAVELADAVGSLAGDDQRDPFLELWRDHIGYFVDYAGAAATDDDAAAEQALMDLDQYRYDAGDFFEEVSAGELPADAVADGLGMHVRSVAGVIDSLNEALVQNS